MSKYKYGRNKERQVGKYLTKKGWDVWIARGSRGPCDLFAAKNFRKWCIQVKASRKTQITSSVFSSKAERRLKNAATRKKAIPVLALVAQNTVGFYSVRNYRLLDPK